MYFALGAANNTYTRLDATFDLGGGGGGGGGGSSSGDPSPSGVLNATYSRKTSDDLSRGSGSQDANMDDMDRLSTTSDCSLTHQLNDVGDVQQIARIQEAALMQQRNTAAMAPQSANQGPQGGDRDRRRESRVENEIDSSFL